MAPEVMLNRNHGLQSDYFALGVIAFECMTGKRPYRGKNRNEIKGLLNDMKDVTVTKRLKLLHDELNEH